MADNRQIVATGVATGVSTVLSSPHSPTPTPTLTSTREESKIAVKQYPEMEAYIELFTQMTAGLKPQLNPYEHWQSDSTLRGSRILKIASQTPFYTGTSRIKTVTLAMLKEEPYNKFYKMIKGYLSEHASPKKGIVLPTIKQLSEFILDGMAYIFVSIEIEFRNDPKSRIAHYKIMRDLCEDIIAADKWSMEYQSWRSLFLTDYGSYFSCFIHELSLKLSDQLKAAPVEIKSEEVADQARRLADHLKNALATSKEMLLRLISNEEIPPGLFHNDGTIDAFKNQDYTYFINSDAIPNKIKLFVRNKERYEFIKEQLISSQHEKTMRQIDDLANTSSQQSVHQRLWMKPEAPEHAKPALPEAREYKLREYKPHSRPTTVATVATTKNPSTQIFTLQENALQAEYFNFLNRKKITLFAYLQHSVPEQFQKALRTTSTKNSVTQAKHDKASALVFLIMDLCDIIDLLEKNSILAQSIYEYISQHRLLGELMIDSDLQTLETDLHFVSNEIRSTYTEILRKSFDLRIEIKELNNSQWGLNVNVILKDVRTVLDIFDDAVPLLLNMKKSLTLQHKYENFMKMIVQKRRIALTQSVFFGIPRSKAFFEDSFEILTSLLYQGAQFQKQLAFPGQQNNDFYLQAIVAQSQRSLVPTKSGSHAIDKLSVADFFTAKLEKFGLHLSLQEIIQGGRIYEEDSGELYLQIQEIQIPLEEDARDWIIAQRNHGRRVVQPSSTTESHASYVQNGAGNFYQSSLPAHKKQLQDTINIIRQTLPRLNRREDTSAKIFRWWLPLAISIIGLPLLLGVGLYLLWTLKATRKDLAQYESFQNTLTTHERELESILQFEQAQERPAITLEEDKQTQNTHLPPAHTQATPTDAPSSQPGVAVSPEMKTHRPPLTPEPTTPGATPPLSTSTHILFSSRTPSVELLALQSLPEPQITSADEKVPASELSRCATSIKGLIPKDKITNLFKCKNIGDLKEQLDFYLKQVTTNKIILQRPEYQQSIYDSVIASFLVAKEMQQFTHWLLIATAKSFQVQSQSLTNESANNALNAAINKLKKACEKFDNQELSNTLEMAYDQDQTLKVYKNPAVKAFIITLAKEAIHPQNTPQTLPAFRAR